MLLFAITVFVVAQDSTIVPVSPEVVQAVVPVDSTGVDVPVITGGTVKEYIKNNLWAILFILYGLGECWFGQTQKLKAGSLLAFIWNMIGKIINKQLPTRKAKFMTDEQIKAVRGGK